MTNQLRRKFQLSIVVFATALIAAACGASGTAPVSTDAGGTEAAD